MYFIHYTCICPKYKLKTEASTYFKHIFDVIIAFGKQDFGKSLITWNNQNGNHTRE